MTIALRQLSRPHVGRAREGEFAISLGHAERKVFAMALVLKKWQFSPTPDQNGNFVPFGRTAGGFHLLVAFAPGSRPVAGKEARGRQEGNTMRHMATFAIGRAFEAALTVLCLAAPACATSGESPPDWYREIERMAYAPPPPPPPPPPSHAGGGWPPTATPATPSKAEIAMREQREEDARQAADRAAKEVQREQEREADRPSPD